MVEFTFVQSSIRPVKGSAASVPQFCGHAPLVLRGEPYKDIKIFTDKAKYLNLRGKEEVTSVISVYISETPPPPPGRTEIFWRLFPCLAFLADQQMIPNSRLGKASQGHNNVQKNHKANSETMADLYGRLSPSLAAVRECHAGAIH
jgi:hypothetical protein